MTRALTGWGAALTLRARIVMEADAGAAQAAALAAAASEKYRAALESPHASSASFAATSRAVVFMDWGDALRLAAESSAAAAAAASDLGRGGGVSPDECWARALQCYREAERLDPDGCGAVASTFRAACEDALDALGGDVGFPSPQQQRQLGRQPF